MVAEISLHIRNGDLRALAWDIQQGEHLLVVWPAAFAASVVLVGPDEVGQRNVDMGPS